MDRRSLIFGGTALFAASIPWLSGCGGGGSPLPSPTPSPSPSPSPGSGRLRTLRAGDRFSFSASGRATSDRGVLTDVAGDAAVVYLDTLFFGASALGERFLANLQGSGVTLPLDSITYVSQDSSAAIVLLGREDAFSGEPLPSVGTYVETPGQLSDGLTRTENRVIGGRSSTAVFTVVGRESVTVPAGTFDAFRCRRTEDFDAVGEFWTDTLWYVPSFGHWVKARIERADTGGTTLALDLEMTSSQLG